MQNMSESVVTFGKKKSFVSETFGKRGKCCVTSFFFSCQKYNALNEISSLLHFSFLIFFFFFVSFLNVPQNF